MKQKIEKFEWREWKEGNKYDGLEIDNASVVARGDKDMVKKFMDSNNITIHNTKTITLNEDFLNYASIPFGNSHLSTDLLINVLEEMLQERLVKKRGNEFLKKAIGKKVTINYIASDKNCYPVVILPENDNEKYYIIAPYDV